MMNQIRVSLLAGVLATSLGVATPIAAEAKCQNNNTSCQQNICVDVNGDGICDYCNANFVDADGDGICDNRNNNFVDYDNDGVCDNRDTRACTGKRGGRGSHGRCR